jgi:hypothetical protein
LTAPPHARKHVYKKEFAARAIGNSSHPESDFFAGAGVKET